MRLAKLLALLLAVLLTAATLNALSAPGPGRGGDDEGEDADGSEGRSRERGNASAAGASNRGGGDDDEDDDGLRDFARAQQEEREDFREDLEDRRADCRAGNASQRGACERDLAEERKAFEEEQREDFLEARGELREDRALGGFALANGTFAGKFVTFTWDGAAITDYTVGGCVAFERIVLSDAGEAELEFSKHGRAIHVEAEDARLKLHDNPGGVIAARARGNATVAFHLADDLTASLNASKLSLAGCGNWTASLSGHNLTFAGGIATFDRQATFVAHDDHPAAPRPEREHRDEVERAKADRRVGVEIHVVGDGDDDVEEVELDENLRVTTERLGREGWRVTVNGTGDEGRTIVLNVGAGLLRGDRVDVTFFDEVRGELVAAPIRQAGSLADVLDPADDDGPEFWVVHDAEGTQLLVSIPSWSTHAFAVQGVLAEVSPNVLAGALGAVLFVAVAGAGLLRRRRQ